MVKFHNADDALRAALIRRFAEIDDNGAPQRCVCADKKILFADERAVNGFIREAYALDQQTRRPYPCARVRGPWHFTSRTAETPETPDAP